MPKFLPKTWYFHLMRLKCLECSLATSLSSEFTMCYPDFQEDEENSSFSLLTTSTLTGNNELAEACVHFCILLTTECPAWGREIVRVPSSGYQKVIFCK